MIEVWHTLIKPDRAFCADLAERRHVAAMKNDRKSVNNSPTDPEWSRQQHWLGVHTEFPFKLYLDSCRLNYRWYDFVEKPKGTPDFDIPADSPLVVVDVKARRKRHHSLLVQEDDPPKWAYVSVWCDHPTYLIDGWCWGHEAQTLPPEELNPKRPVHTVRRGNPMLKCISELIDIASASEFGSRPRPKRV